MHIKCIILFNHKSFSTSIKKYFYFKKLYFHVIRYLFIDINVNKVDTIKFTLKVDHKTDPKHPSTF